MTAEFVRFDIEEILTHREYARRLRLARKHRDWLDQQRLMNCPIDDHRAYLLSDKPIIVGAGAYESTRSGLTKNGNIDDRPISDGSGADRINDIPVIERNGTAQQVGIDARELQTGAWGVIVFTAIGYFVGVPIKDQLANWGFAFIVVSLTWPWLGPWLENRAHCRLLGWLAVLYSGLAFLVSWVGLR